MVTDKEMGWMGLKISPLKQNKRITPKIIKSIYAKELERAFVKLKESFRTRTTVHNSKAAKQIYTHTQLYNTLYEDVEDGYFHLSELVGLERKFLAFYFNQIAVTMT